MDWFRTHHGISTDVKLAVIAAKLGVPRCEVGWIWMVLLDHASQNAGDRGNIGDLRAEDITMLSGVPEERAQLIINSFRERKMLSRNGKLTAWEKRQPDADPTNADRQRRYRDRKKGEVTEITLRNALRNTDRTDRTDRTEQNRDDVTPRASDFPATDAAVRRKCPTADLQIVTRITEAAIQSFLSVDRPKMPPPTDADIAEAVEQAAKDSPKQQGAGLFLKTVPAVIKSWAELGRHPPGANLKPFRPYVKPVAPPESTDDGNPASQPRY
jgi:hypothetical protein